MSAAAVHADLSTPPEAARWPWYARHGAHPVSLGNLKDQEFTCPEMPGLLTYRVSGRCWLVAGDPLCAEADQGALVQAFLARARQERRIPVFLPVSQALAQRAGDQFGVKLRVAQTPYIHLPEYSAAGRRGKMLRGNLNRAQRSGVTLTEVPASEHLERTLEHLGTGWRSSHRLSQPLGWVLELDALAWAHARRYFLARDAARRPVALLVVSPLPARHGWHLEDVIRTTQAPVGSAAALVHHALEVLRDEDFTWATLGSVPLVREENGANGHTPLLEKALYALKPWLERVYSIDGLAQFKRQFPPHHWEDEYLLLPGPWTLPFALHGLWHALLPQGLAARQPNSVEPQPRPTAQPVQLLAD